MNLRARWHALIDETLDAVEAMRTESLEGVYRSDGPLPARASRETFNRCCSRGDIDGAEKVRGRGFGYWQCSKEAWHRARAKRSAPAPLRLVEKSDEQLADEMIAASGFRGTR